MNKTFRVPRRTYDLLRLTSAFGDSKLSQINSSSVCKQITKKCSLTAERAI